MRRALLSGVLIALTAGLAAAEPEIVDLDAEPGRSWLREDHYGVFRGSARVGWLRRARAREDLAGVQARHFTYPFVVAV